MRSWLSSLIVLLGASITDALWPTPLHAWIVVLIATALNVMVCINVFHGRMRRGLNRKTKLPGFPTFVSGPKYLTTDNGHRTTLVVGMADTISYCTTFFSSEQRKHIDKFLKYMYSLTGDEMRKILDDYLIADQARQKFAIASSFIAAIEEKMGKV